MVDSQSVVLRRRVLHLLPKLLMDLTILAKF